MEVMTTMNSNKYNETKKQFENSKLEDEKTYQELSKTIDDNIKVISKMNASNCEDILVNMYENYYEVFALDNNIDELNKLTKELNEAKNSLINKQNITFDDILNEISDKIMTIYLLSCLGISITTTDALDFLKKYYPSINWKDNFYGVASTTEKADMLELLANIKDYDEIYYVDGNLESLIDIEALVPRHLLDEKISLFHVTTFVNDIL